MWLLLILSSLMLFLCILGLVSVFPFIIFFCVCVVCLFIVHWRPTIDGANMQNHRRAYAPSIISISLNSTLRIP